jgi:hypothetical protein
MRINVICESSSSQRSFFTWKKIFTRKIGIKKLFDHGVASRMSLLTDEIQNKLKKLLEIS